jgi:hypothetical protein
MAKAQAEIQPLESPDVSRQHRLAALLEEVTQDAEERGTAYLRDSVVPEGGE